AARVGLRINEVQRIGRDHAGVMLGPAAVHQHFEALFGAHFEVELALGADEEVGLEILAKRDRAAIFALGPETFRAHAPLFRRRRLLNCFFVALEPSHGEKDARPSAVRSLKPYLNSLYHAEPEYLLCRDASLLSFP